MIKNFYMLVAALMLTSTVNAQNVVLWGNNKDAQFDGGLNGWTTKGLSATPQDSAKNAIWTWTKDGKVPGSLFSANTPQIANSTFANGAAIMNADNLETAGVAVGKGKAPGPLKSELVSPVFAIPATEKELSIAFNQYFRNFQANCYVAYSTDGGTTWSPDININPGQAVNAATNVRNQRRNIVLKGAVGSPNFRLKFTFDGRLYVWVIDDITIVRSAQNNLSSNDDWYSINHNRFAPKGLTEPFSMMNDVSNKGLKLAKNVKLNAKIVNEVTTKEVYNETLSMGDIKSGDTIQNKIFPKQVLLTEVGDYTGTYTVTSDSTDQEPADNTVSFRTSVSDSLFSRDVNRTRSLRPGDANWGAGVPHSWTIGNTFFVPKGGSKYTASMVQFGINTPAPMKDKVVNVYVIKWVDANDDGNAQEGERELVGFVDGGYTVKGTEPASVAGANMNTNLNVKLPIRDFQDPSKKLKLQDETNYIVAVEWVAPDDKTNMLVEATADVNKYSPSFYAALQGGKRRVGYQIGIGDAKDWEADAFGGTVLPCIRMSVNAIGVGSKDIALLPINAVQVAPNPAKDEFSVFFNMPETTSEVTMKLVDMTGKIIRTQVLENVKNDAILFNTSDVAAGTYNLVVTSEQGSTVKKVVIVR